MGIKAYKTDPDCAGEEEETSVHFLTNNGLEKKTISLLLENSTLATTSNSLKRLHEGMVFVEIGNG